MDMSRNSLVGTIPNSYGTLTKLEYFLVEENKLTGTFPSTMTKMPNMKTLTVAGNSLVGTIPNSLSTYSKLTSVNFKNNMFTGTIPSAIGGLPLLASVDLSKNMLQGTIPNTFSALKNAKTMKLQNNYLTMGTASVVPESTFSDATRAGTLDISMNCLTYKSTVNPLQSTVGTNCKGKPFHRQNYAILSSL